jgi:hypothetical protein
MKPSLFVATLLATTVLAYAAFAGQAPGAATDADIAISHRDRVYAAEQFSNTVSVTDPVDLSAIRRKYLHAGTVWGHDAGFFFKSLCIEHRDVVLAAHGNPDLITVGRKERFVRRTADVSGVLDGIAGGVGEGN